MWGWIWGGGGEGKPAKFKNRAWRLYEWSSTTTPGHTLGDGNCPWQDAIKPLCV